MSKATRKLVPRDDRVTINHEFASLEQFITEYVTNISRSGVFIKTRTPLAVGTKVNLKFTLIMDELETIAGIGEVVRVQLDDPTGMGVVFTELTSHSQTLIARLITKRRRDRDDAVTDRRPKIDDTVVDKRVHLEVDAEDPTDRQPPKRQRFESQVTGKRPPPAPPGKKK
jgi:uncharacterized protein (TIGR02266 family)